VAVICQKPMAPDLATARRLVALSREKGVPFYIHENFRWQAPIRRLKAILDAGEIGPVFKARVSFCSAFPVFDNQPFLAELDQFILTDIGSHVLDIVRYLFGEAKTLHCLTRRVNPKIKGEDVANVLLEMTGGVHCYTEMSYASLLERETFPQTLVLAEGTAVRYTSTPALCSKPPPGPAPGPKPCSRRSTTGWTPTTPWCIRAWSTASATCSTTCSAAAKPKPPGPTISKPSNWYSPPTTPQGKGNLFV
jgi:predicted dehydrogenase